MFSLDFRKGLEVLNFNGRKGISIRKQIPPIDTPYC